MGSVDRDRVCSRCVWGHRFIKRPDEPTDQGCSKLGWEGYTSDDSPACHGAHFMLKAKRRTIFGKREGYGD